MVQNGWSQNLLIGVLVLILLGLTWWGWDNGVRAAKAKRIVKDAIAMKAGFAEFQKDQNRYPATVEFDDNNLLRPYIANYPPITFPTETCPDTYNYYSAAPAVYELRFCLPKAVNGFEEGWNTLKP